MAKTSDNFDASTYVGVHERLAQFRNQYPNGRIATFRTNEQGGVSFKTIICRDKDDAELFATTSVAAACGHSYLPDWAREEDSKVEEYAETVAVGRALANLGYGIEKSIASAEEMTQFKRLNSNTQTKTPKAKKTAKVESEEIESSNEEEPKLKPTRRFKRTAKLKN